MPLFMNQFAYSAEAWAAMAKNPQDREAPLRRLAEAMGGKVLAAYYCFGEYDGVVIFEAPDETAALAFSVGGVVAGHLKELKTTILFTMQDTLEAARKAGAVIYPAPKG